VVAVMVTARPLRAQVVDFDTTHTIFHEAPTRTNMTVYSPGANLAVTPVDWLTVNAGWEADVVSGASVAIKAGPAFTARSNGADVVTTASVHDFRNVANGGFTLRKDAVSFTGGYAYSTEHDYRSNSFNVAARTETYEHDTQLEIDYAHNFDQVCDRVQDTLDTSPTLFHALEDSTGCFTSNPLRTTHDIAIDSMQASWSQAWTPVLQTQLIYTAQVIDGFQSDPYRSVIIAPSVVAQEHVPDIRIREAIALRANIFLRPLRCAALLGPRVRGHVGHRERHRGGRVRAVPRGRVSRDTARPALRAERCNLLERRLHGGQPAARPQGVVLDGRPRAQPFLELVGRCARGLHLTKSRGRLLGIMTSLKRVRSFDVINDNYEQYTLGGQPIEGAHEYSGSSRLTALF
jgi:hypothetical protein